MKNIELFLKMALLVSQKSVAPDKKVGAVSVDSDGNLISYGFNNNIDEETSYTTVDDEGRTLPTVIHAEMDMWIRASKQGKSLNGATLYVTHSPCMYCATHMLGVGIKRIYYLLDFKGGISNDFLNRNGVKTIQVCGIDPEIDKIIEMQDEINEDNSFQPQLQLLLENECSCGSEN